MSPRRTGHFPCARVARISRHSASHRDHLPHARSVALPVAESRHASDRSSSGYQIAPTS
ncbi:hypothetical protein GUJ93_ZPchr0006g43998, partial [Zizania palustris]